MHKWQNIVFAAAVVALTIGCTENAPSGVYAADSMPKSAKRGVAFNFTNISDLPLLSPYISWDYNWGNTTNDNAALWFDSNEMDYCPMCWNGNYNADNIRAYVAAHPNTKYLLAFNEPNLKDQARMTPSEAAALWAPVVALAKELKLKLVSPAMNYGTLSGYNDPIKWLDEFFAQPEVNINDIYAISIHCYMSSVSGLKGYVEMFEKYNKHIWLTEFCAWDPKPSSEEPQMSYMCSALNYLEQHATVERYAWFIPRFDRVPTNNNPYCELLTHDSDSQLTDAGKIYTLFSTFDKRCYLNADHLIYAGEYIALSNEATQVRPNTDTQATALAGREGLKVQNFSEGDKLTYQVVTKQAASSIVVRYSGYSNAIMNILVDGKQVNYVDLQRTGDAEKWQQAQTAASVTAGYHTVELELMSGSVNLSGLLIQ
ncbi:MAG: carbohydrate-binding protein [Paludibacteraceae bacterium]|nr:carbohydrate-binding protein [Paludibacteraceae bacterium]